MMDATSPRGSGGAFRASHIPLAVTGRIGDLDGNARVRLFDRGRATDPGVAAAVTRIIADVGDRGDAALQELAARFDGVQRLELEVPLTAAEDARERLDPAVRAALEQAATAIAAFHRAQRPEEQEIEVQPGVRLGRRPDPLSRVGVYAPGGRAAYPSSVLMGVVPARVAGVDQVVVCSPPGRDGLPPATVLAACAIAGADRIFALGGAGAVAAMALGTATVPAVDRIVGPGNAYVAEAKRQLTGVVGIDCPAGPSEVLVLADDTADPELVAAELLAQAEHDPDAAAVLVATDAVLLEAVGARLAALLPEQPRGAIMRSALEMQGALLLADDLDQAADFATRYAPEHLLLLVREPRALLARIRCAGTVFLGPASSVAFGDYLTGANHVLPTAGLARAYSGLSTRDFVRWTTYQEVAVEAAARLAGPTVVLAEAEGLPAHARAARLRGSTATGVGDRAAAPTSRPSFRPAYHAIELYDPRRAPCEIDLSDNTNLFGPAPSVNRTLASLPATAITRYPSVYATQLKEQLAGLLDVGPENVATGCGSDDVIDSALRAFCEPGSVVAHAEPTFSMAASFVRMNACRPVAVRLGRDFQLEPDRLLRQDATVTYLCRPNNPTGTQFDRAAVLALAAGARGVILVDEAYADFADDHLVVEAAASDRLLVLRTLSKAYGLAGVRVGFAVGPADLIREVEKSRGPYKVSAVAEATARAVLSHDRDWVAEQIDAVRRNRERLRSELQARGYRVWPSAANFLLVQCPVGQPAELWHAGLRSRGVAVRPFPALPHAGDCVRVTVGPWPLMERFLTALEDTVAAVPRPRL